MEEKNRSSNNPITGMELPIVRNTKMNDIVDIISSLYENTYNEKLFLIKDKNSKTLITKDCEIALKIGE